MSTTLPHSSSMTPSNPNDDRDQILATSDDDHARREWLIHNLGETVCRQLGIYRIPDDLVLSVVIPVFNEVRTLHEILRQVRAVPIAKQIILVDDCSTDGTTDLLRKWAETESDLTVVFHEKNRGK